MQIHTGSPKGSDPPSLIILRSRSLFLTAFTNTFHLLRCSECPESVTRPRLSSGRSWSVLCMVSTRFFPPVMATILWLMLGRLCRCIHHSLYRCVLCPVGEVVKGPRVQPLLGICHGVLWDHRHCGKRDPSARKPRSGIHPILPRRVSSYRSPWQYERFCTTLRERRSICPQIYKPPRNGLHGL